MNENVRNTTQIPPRLSSNGVAGLMSGQPSPILFSPAGHNIFLGDIYRGASAFLVCSGPSLRSMNLSLLSNRGVLTCAVNNAAAVFRPNLWVMYDDPGSFADSIWRDPAILKFVPIGRLGLTIRARDADGNLVETTEKSGNMPATFGFRSNASFDARRWLYEDSINCGCAGDVTDELGITGCRSVMLVALRLLFYFGVRRVFLLGCDFRMSYQQHNYGFVQNQSRRCIRRNNLTYRVLSARLEHLQPHFVSAGYEIFNCTPDSDLKVFPFMNFAEAVELVAETIPKRWRRRAGFNNHRYKAK